LSIIRKNVKVKKTVLSLAVVAGSLMATAQTTYLPLRSAEYDVIDKLETMDGFLQQDFNTASKPLSRKGMVNFLKVQQRIGLTQANSFSRVDLHNIQRAISISGEWAETADGDDGSINSKRPILKYFYQKQADFVHVNTDDFFLVVNPVIGVQAQKEDNVGGMQYVNARGAELRGRILNRIGFYTFLTDNQEKAASYVNSLEQSRAALPGMDYYITQNGAFDYLNARGYIDFNAFKDHMNVTFGYDKQFIGDGIRSLIVSDNGAPATFLRLRTRIGKLNFDNLFMELTPDYMRGGDQRLPKKYAAIHQVNINATRWLNVGVFESTMFSKRERFGVEYLMPVIFYNTAARALGADQKTSLGFNFKAVALRTVQVYGQAYFDQLSLSDLGNGSWKNQYGLQLGAKYFNAFTLSNLDLQGEVNVVRPFTYTADDGMANHTHYNQPLAHPYGAGFAEIIGVARYQPLPRLYITAKAIYAARGMDSMGITNYGNNIFKPVDSRTADNDLGIAAGDKMNSIYFNFNAAYEVRPNMFLEAGATHLRRDLASGIVLPSVTMVYGGVRVNIARREIDFH